MEKVVNYTVPKNNTFRQFYSITMFGVVFYHPSGLKEPEILIFPKIAALKAALWAAFNAGFLAESAAAQPTVFTTHSGDRGSAFGNFGSFLPHTNLRVR